MKCFSLANIKYSHCSLTISVKLLSHRFKFFLTSSIPNINSCGLFSYFQALSFQIYSYSIQVIFIKSSINESKKKASLARKAWPYHNYLKQVLIFLKLILTNRRRQLITSINKSVCRFFLLNFCALGILSMRISTNFSNWNIYRNLFIMSWFTSFFRRWFYKKLVLKLLWKCCFWINTAFH